MKRYLVEFVGTFFLALAVAFTGDAMAIGLMLMALVYIGGPVSGGHYNPAVTVAVWLRGALESRFVLNYIIAQILGAILAGGVFYAIAHNWLIMRLPEGILGVVGMVPEILMTFVLCSVVLAIATTERFRNTGVTGFAIGLTLTSIATVGGIFNPAIGLSSLFGGLLVGDQVAMLNATLAHIAGPILGGALAAYWFNYIHDTQVATDSYRR